MFIDIKDLAVRKVRVHRDYPSGTLDFQSADFRQIEPVEVRATAELVDNQIRITGSLQTKVELVCARCLELLVEDINRDFDLFYRPMTELPGEQEAHLSSDDTELGFFEGEGLFLADVLVEQVNLAIPMKIICRSDCRGLCPHCGANLNHEGCRCHMHPTDPRFEPLARLKQDWLKKQ